MYDYQDAGEVREAASDIELMTVGRIETSRRNSQNVEQFQYRGVRGKHRSTAKAPKGPPRQATAGKGLIGLSGRIPRRTSSDNGCGEKIWSRHAKTPACSFDSGNTELEERRAWHATARCPALQFHHVKDGRDMSLCVKVLNYMTLASARASR